MNPKTVEMSVVILAPDGWEPIRRTLRHLRNQTAADHIELVVVLPAGRREEGEERLDEFAAVHLVEVSPFHEAGAAFAAGVRAAGAEIVAYAEEHSFPEPGWAAAILEAHRGPWAAVGASLENANPATGISWAALVSDFGPEIAPLARGEAGEIAGHHTAYKREVLMRRDQELDNLLEVEWVLHEQLRESGERLFQEDRAVSRHLNPSRLVAHLVSQANGGRLFAGNRARVGGWSPLRRAVWVAGSPLIVVLRLSRALPHLRRARPGPRARAFPALVLGLVVNGVGQALGYALGPGRAAERRLAIDVRRTPALADRDRAELDATPLGDLPRLMPAGR